MEFNVSVLGTFADSICNHRAIQSLEAQIVAISLQKGTNILYHNQSQMEIPPTSSHHHPPVSQPKHERSNPKEESSGRRPPRN